MDYGGRGRNVHPQNRPSRGVSTIAQAVWGGHHCSLAGPTLMDCSSLFEHMHAMPWPAGVHLWQAVPRFYMRLPRRICAIYVPLLCPPVGFRSDAIRTRARRCRLLTSGAFGPRPSLCSAKSPRLSRAISRVSLVAVRLRHGIVARSRGTVPLLRLLLHGGHTIVQEGY